MTPSTLKKEMEIPAAEIDSAVNALRAMVSLISSSQLNRGRFETCKSRVLNLQLPPAAKMQAKVFFDSASRYNQYGEVGALRFELKSLIQFLRNQL